MLTLKFISPKYLLTPKFQFCRIFQFSRICNAARLNMRICNPIHTLFRYIILSFVGHFSNCKFSYSLFTPNL